MTNGHTPPTLWRVYFRIEDSERDALQQAAMHSLPVEDYAIHTEVFSDGSEGPSEFAFSLAARDPEEVEREAHNVFGRLRWRAELDRFGGELILFHPADEPAWDRALMAARRAFDREDHSGATLHAQIACATIETAVFLALLEVRAGFPADIAKDLGGRQGVRNAKARKLFCALSGLDIDAEDWWQDYKDHAVRRNLVAHQGAAVTGSEGERSLAAAAGFCRFMGDLLSRLEDERRGEDPPPARTG